MALALRDVLGSFDVEGLAEGMARRRLMHRREACAIRPETIYSLEELEQLLLQDGPARKDLKITFKGHAANLEALGIVKDGQLRPLMLRQLTRQGASIILNNLERHVPKLWTLACDAERTLQDRVVISAVASLSKLPALPAHYDPEDLVVVQVEGSKIWRFFGEPVDCGMGYHPKVDVPSEVSETVVMRPGDVLFVPAGLHHHCEAEGMSLHVVLLVRHATLLDFLGDLFREHPSLNRPLRPLLGRDSLTEQAEGLKAEMISRFDEADVADWLAEWNATRARVTGLDLRVVSDGGSMQAIASLAVTMADAAPERQWKVGGVEFKPGAGAFAVVSILKAGPRTVGELLEVAGLEAGADEARAGFEQLVDKGLVQISAPPGPDDPAPPEAVVTTD